MSELPSQGEVGALRDLPKLAARGLPPRVHELAQGLLGLFLGELEGALRSAAGGYEAQLFELAEKARSPAQQEHYLAARTQFRALRDRLGTRFAQHLEAALAGLRDRRETAARAPAAPSSAGLALVEVSEVDEESVVRDISARAEMRAGVELFLFGQRMGVLAGGPAFESETLPIGPHALCRMLADAAEDLGLAAEHRQLLLRQFEKPLLALSASLFEKANHWLAGHGVLPHLSYVPHRARPSARPELHAVPPPEQASARVASRPQSAPASRPVPVAVPAGALPARSTAERSWEATRVAARWPGMPSLAAEATEDAEQGAEDQVLYDTLRHLLAQRRSLVGKLGGLGGARAADRPGKLASPEAVLQALERLQSSAAITVPGREGERPRSVADLKRDLLMQLRVSQPEGEAVGLPREHEDALELVGMLLDHLGRELRPGSPAVPLLTRLQVPLLRVAMQDRSFFDDRRHPVRQLLNVVAETADWFGSDDPADRSMLQRISQAVDRVVQEFHGDLAVMEQLVSDLREHLKAQVRRAEVAERRHVEAARGKEKLALARIEAGRIVGQLLEGRDVPRYVAGLLGQSWSDVLALNLLRHGPGSPEVERQLDIARRLIEGAERRGRMEAEATPAAVPEPEVQALRGEVEQGLLQVGYHEADAQAVSEQLVRPAEAKAEEGVSRTELTVQLRQRPRFGADAEDLRDDPGQLSAAEKDWYERLKRMAFGSWFEFVDPDGGVTRRRMSWFSPVTGRALLVNHRGQRVGEVTLSDLARDLHAGRAHHLHEAHLSIVDRAWNAVVGALRAFAGKGGEKAEARA